jgi:hypothetical protein
MDPIDKRVDSFKEIIERIHGATEELVIQDGFLDTKVLVGNRK